MLAYATVLVHSFPSAGLGLGLSLIMHPLRITNFLYMRQFCVGSNPFSTESFRACSVFARVLIVCREKWQKEEEIVQSTSDKACLRRK